MSDNQVVVAALEPYAVRIPVAKNLLGGKSRSTIYEAVGRGELVAVKDGTRTLIVVDSIKKYCARMRPAQIKPPTPRGQINKPKTA